MSSRRAARELIINGRVRVNGHVLRKGEAVAPGDVVEVTDAPTPARLVANPELKLEILFADAAALVVNKPAPMPCHPLREGERDTVMNAVVAAYPETASAGDKALEGGLVHRLDNGTSGALMIARNPDAFATLRAAIRTGRVMRRYYALATGRLDHAIEIATPIAHHPKNPRRMVVVDTSETLGRSVVVARRGVAPGRPASSVVEPLAHAGGAFTLVAVKPRTGHRHQIRVHLASLGMPLAGDELYGGAALAGLRPGRLWLHLAALEFDSPASGHVKVSAPLPADLIAALIHLGIKPPA